MIANIPSVKGEMDMMLIDRMGSRYERLVVTARAPNASKTDTNARWFCRCDCGRMVTAYGQDLAKGKIKSCGCLNAERIFKHGRSRTPVYEAWKQIFQRCENPDCDAYKNYGARGITVDPSWRDFNVFIADMGERPEGYTLERKDNDGPYSKSNCIWANMKVQQNNSRRNRNLTAFGKTQNLTQWAKEYRMPRDRLHSRLRSGWELEEALIAAPQYLRHKES
jgi:hypothetical protein